eukprot:TRINITY_DN15812_c0_g1_i1.p1 TRINITY_DN15812_c0_g1~~TRINITY_DN15812_c0_g1_i1.p1  ORF type:complete len:323 (+),score=98.59 TRINITY_DN15812_c0_g1_i1:90-971(+)
MGRVGEDAVTVPRFASSTQKKQKPPPQKGPIFLYFVDVSDEDLQRVAAAETKEDVRQLLKMFFKIEGNDRRGEILADFHYHNYSFCVSRDFSADKISTFLSIMKILLDESVARKMPVDQAFEFFQSWLLKHSVERPPWSVGIFVLDDIRAITDYVHSTFFRHYRLYMYAFMAHCDIDIRMDPRNVMRPAFAAAPFPPQLLRAEAEVQREDRDVFECYEDLMKDFKLDPKAQPDWIPQQSVAADLPADEATGQLDRAAIIKRKVEEGVKELMAKFETKLQEQDEDFKRLMAESG